jgi:predicted Zn-dependent peptidase
MIAAILISSALFSVQIATPPNGMAVVAIPISDAKTFSAQLFVLSGSAFEGRSNSGLHHLLEHMLFRGGAADRLAENAGSFLNATTNRESTRYFCEGPGVSWKQGIAAVAELISKPNFADFSLEVPVIRQENTLARLVSSARAERQLWQAFGGSTGWALPPGGLEKGPSPISATDLEKVYRAEYVGPNMVFAISGPFSEAEAISAATEAFKSVPLGIESKAPALPLFEAASTEGEPGAYAIGVLAPGFDDIQRYAAFQVVWEWLTGAGGLCDAAGIRCDAAFGPSSMGALATVVIWADEAKAREILAKVAGGLAETDIQTMKKRLRARYERLAREPSQAAALAGLGILFAGRRIDMAQAIQSATADKIRAEAALFVPEKAIVAVAK